MAHLVVSEVGTVPRPVATVPAGGTLFVQNVGTENVTLGVDQELAAGTGIVLAKAPAAGTPGGSLTTYPPGDPEPQVWYGVTAAGTSKVVAVVVTGVTA